MALRLRPSVFRLCPSAVPPWHRRSPLPSSAQHRAVRSCRANPAGSRTNEDPGHGIEVVEVAHELVEAVQARRIFVEVTEVVLAKLEGFVTLHLEGASNS